MSSKQRFILLIGSTDAEIGIPQDFAGGKRVKRIERAVRWLWSRGIYPGPAALGLRLHGRARRDLNGVETAVRNRMLKQLKIARQRRYKIDPETGRPYGEHL